MHVRPNINGFEVSSSQASVQATAGRAQRRASQIYWTEINSSKNKHKKESVALNDVCFVSIATALCYFVNSVRYRHACSHPQQRRSAARRAADDGVAFISVILNARGSTYATLSKSLCELLR